MDTGVEYIREPRPKQSCKHPCGYTNEKRTTEGLCKGGPSQVPVACGATTPAKGCQEGYRSELEKLLEAGKTACILT